MEEITNVLINNGIGACCLIYFMWLINTTIKEFTTALKETNEILNNVNTRLTIIETELQKRSNEG